MRTMPMETRIARVRFITAREEKCVGFYTTGGRWDRREEKVDRSGLENDRLYMQGRREDVASAAKCTMREQ